MRRRVLLIVVIVATLGTVTLGVWWYVRQNTGMKLLSRAEVAMSADQYRRALELAENYLAENPNDWRGHFTRGRALIHLGSYEQARRSLDAAAELEPDEVAIKLLRADTHFLPAVRSVRSGEDVTDAAVLSQAIAELDKANEILNRVRTDEKAVTLDVGESVGLNHDHIAEAHSRLAEFFSRKAEVATASRQEDVAAQWRQQQQQELDKASKAQDQAVETLLGVVVADPSRPQAARALIDLCIDRGDDKSLSIVREAIMSLENPPAYPAAVLALYNAQNLLAGPEPDSHREQLAEIAQFLEQLVCKHPDQTQIKVIRAKLAMQMGRPVTALEVCDRVLKDEPLQYEARMIKGSALLAAGKAAEAEKLLFELKTDFPQWADAHYAYAQAAQAAQAQADAEEKARLEPLLLEALRTATTLDPRHAGAHRDLARFLLHRGFYEQSFQDAQDYYKAHPDEPSAVELMAKAAWLSEQPEVARSVLSQARQAHPADLIMLRVVARGYDELGDDALKLEVCQQAAKLTPTSSRERVALALTFSAMGDHYERQGAFRQAKEQYRRAVETEPGRQIHKVNLARVLCRIGDFEQAQALLDQITEPIDEADFLRVQIRLAKGEAVDFHEVLRHLEAGEKSALRLAQIYLASGRPAQCVQLAEGELGKSPDGLELRSLLARAYRELGRTDECIEQWAAVIEAAPEQMPAYLNLAEALESQDVPGGIAEFFDGIEGARQELVDFAVGSSLARKGQYLPAAEAFGRAAAAPTGSDLVRGTARMNRAGALAEAGRIEAAVDELDGLGGLVGWQRRALEAKVRVLIAKGRARDASLALSQLQALAVETKDADTFATLAQTYLSIQQPERALAVCEAMRKTLGSDDRQYLLHARILLAIGRADEAVPLLAKTVELAGQDRATHVLLAQALDAAGQPARALKALDRLSELNASGQSFALFERGKLFGGWGLFEQAVECFRQLADKGYQSDPRLRLALGDALASAGRPAEAREALEKISPYTREYVQAQRVLLSLARTPAEKLGLIKNLAGARWDRAEAALVRGLVLLEARQAGQAAQVLDEFLRQQPKDASIPAGLAILAVRAKSVSGDLDGARSLAERMAGQDGGPYRPQVGVLLKLQDQPSLASAELPASEAATGVDAFLGLVCASRIDEAEALQEWADRIEQIQALSANDPSKALPADMVVLALLAAGRVDQAEAQLDRMASAGAMGRRVAAAQVAACGEGRIEPSQCARLLEISLAMRLGLIETARSWALELLEAQPGCEWAAWMVVVRNDDREMLDKILMLLTRDEATKDSALAYAIRGELMLTDGQADKAVEQFELAATADPDNAYLLTRLASALEAVGSFEEALTSYRRAYRANGDPIAANNVAYLLARLYPDDPDQLTQAEEFLAAAIKAAPDQPSFWDTAGWLAFLQGRPDQARRQLWRAVKALPNLPEMHYHLGMVEREVGDGELGRWHLQAAVAREQAAERTGRTLTSAEAEAVGLARQALAAMDQER